MRDLISHQRAELLHPKVRQEVVETIIQVESGFPPTIKVRIVQGLRTVKEQDALFAKGRTTPGPIVTKARGGKSYHNYGLAIDFALMYDANGDGNFEELSWNLAKDGDKDGRKDWDEVVNAFKAKGWSWGGNWRTFKDYPHLEKPFNLSVATLFAKYTAKQFITGTEYVKI